VPFGRHSRFALESPLGRHNRPLEYKDESTTKIRTSPRKLRLIFVVDFSVIFYDLSMSLTFLRLRRTAQRQKSSKNPQNCG